MNIRTEFVNQAGAGMEVGCRQWKEGGLGERGEGMDSGSETDVAVRTTWPAIPSCNNTIHLLPTPPILPSPAAPSSPAAAHPTRLLWQLRTVPTSMCEAAASAL